MTSPAAMDFLSASSSGRGGELDSSLPSIKGLLHQVYSTHVSITQALQKQVLQLSELISQKEQQLRDASCQRCTSVKDAFERYKSSHQQIIEKQEVKISLLEGRIAQYEKEQHERSASSAVNVTPERGARTFHNSPDGQRQPRSSDLVSSPKDFILQEDSLGEAGDLVPPSPVGGREPEGCREMPEMVECGGSTSSRVKEPAVAVLQTVPETLECNLYGDGTDDELPSYQPPLKVIAEKDGVRDCAQANLDSVFSEMAPNGESHFGETVAESRGREAVATLEHVNDEAIELVSQESPSLLQRGIFARPAQHDKSLPAYVASNETPQRSTTAEPHCQLLPVTDEERSPSLLTSFAVPKCVRKNDVEPPCLQNPAAVDVTQCDESGPKLQALPSIGKLSLLRKRPVPAAERASTPTAQPSSTAKRKKQTRLSDRYFLSVNRTTVPATRSSRSKKLSQTHVDTHFTDDSIFSMPRKPADPDETFVAPELLQGAKMPVSDLPSSPGDASPAAANERHEPATAEDAHADEASSNSPGVHLPGACNGCPGYADLSGSFASVVDAMVPKASPAVTPNDLGDNGNAQCITFVSCAIYLGSTRVSEYSAITLSDNGFEFSVNDPKKDAAHSGGQLLIRLSASDICRVMAHLPPFNGAVIFVALTRKAFNSLIRLLAISEVEAPSQYSTAGCIDDEDDGDPSDRILSFFTFSRFGGLQKLFLRRALPPGAFCEIGVAAARRIAFAKGISPRLCTQENINARAEHCRERNSSGTIVQETVAVSLKQSDSHFSRGPLAYVNPSMDALKCGRDDSRNLRKNGAETMSVRPVGTTRNSEKLCAKRVAAVKTYDNGTVLQTAESLVAVHTEELHFPIPAGGTMLKASSEDLGCSPVSPLLIGHGTKFLTAQGTVRFGYTGLTDKDSHLAAEGQTESNNSVLTSSDERESMEFNAVCASQVVKKSSRRHLQEVELSSEKVSVCNSEVSVYAPAVSTGVIDLSPRRWPRGHGNSTQHAPFELHAAQPHRVRLPFHAGCIGVTESAQQAHINGDPVAQPCQMRNGDASQNLPLVTAKERSLSDSPNACEHQRVLEHTASLTGAERPENCAFEGGPLQVQNTIHVGQLTCGLPVIVHGGSLLPVSLPVTLSTWNLGPWHSVQRNSQPVLQQTCIPPGKYVIVGTIHPQRGQNFAEPVHVPKSSVPSLWLRVFPSQAVTENRQECLVKSASRYRPLLPAVERPPVSRPTIKSHQQDSYQAVSSISVPGHCGMAGSLMRPSVAASVSMSKNWEPSQGAESLALSASPHKRGCSVQPSVATESCGMPRICTPLPQQESSHCETAAEQCVSLLQLP